MTADVKVVRGLVRRSFNEILRVPGAAASKILVCISEGSAE